MSTDELWKIIEELLPKEEIPDKTSMNRQQVLELCVMLKETDEMFRMLGQIAIMRQEIDKLSRDQF